MILSEKTAFQLERTALDVGRLDMALQGHPLFAAWRWRARLEAALSQSSADGLATDRFRLVAALEGLRLNVGHYPSLIDRIGDMRAVNQAFAIVQMNGAPEPEEEQAIRRALCFFDLDKTAPTLIAALLGLWSWVEKDKDRVVGRAALPRFLAHRGLTATPLPCLCAARAFLGESPDAADWLDHALSVLEQEALDGLHLLTSMEQAWLKARQKVAAEIVKETSRLPSALDALAAAAAISPGGLAKVLNMSLFGASKCLRKLQDLGLACEISGRKSHRLYAMTDLAPVRDEISTPKRPIPGRKRGRPTKGALSAPPLPMTASFVAPIPKSDLPPVDLGIIDQLLFETDQAIRKSRIFLKNRDSR